MLLERVDHDADINATESRLDNASLQLPLEFLHRFRHRHGFVFFKESEHVTAPDAV